MAGNSLQTQKKSSGAAPFDEQLQKTGQLQSELYNTGIQETMQQQSFMAQGSPYGFTPVQLSRKAEVRAMIEENKPSLLSYGDKVRELEIARKKFGSKQK